MSEKQPSSKDDWNNIVSDFKNLVGSISTGIKNAIEQYKTKSEEKKSTAPDQTSKPTPPPASPEVSPPPSVATPPEKGESTPTVDSEKENQDDIKK